MRIEVFNGAVEKRKCGLLDLIVNLGKVDSWTAAGLGLLVLVSQNLKLIQAQLSGAETAQYVREIMSLANIPKMIPIYESEEACTCRARRPRL